jgi:branched-chain amino acid transport system substrate-binding protein
MPIYISVHSDKNIVFDFDNSGFGLVNESTVEREKATLPATCKMQRP